MRKPDDCLPTPKHQRKLLRMKRRYRHYNKQVRIKLSREEMLVFLRERKIRSSRELLKIRKPDEPNVDDYRKEFGSWADAVYLAFGSISVSEHDADYMLKVVSEFNLWTVKRFREARKIDPVSVPSWSEVKKEWGSYTNLIESARRMNLKKLLEEYRKLMRRLGRIPTLSDLKNNDVRMDEAIKFYGSKKEMDEFVLMMRG